MFNMEIMELAEVMLKGGWSIDMLNSYLFREGYEVVENADHCVEGEEKFILSNGWVVVGLM